MELIQFFQQFDLPAILYLMKGITLLGDFHTYFLYVIIILYVFPKKKSLSFIGILLVSWAVNESLKTGFNIPRPPEEFHLVAVTGLGFPSGHAQMAMVVWGWVGNQFNRLIPAGVMIFMIGFSRIYLGVHYPNQVLGGWAIGFTLILIWIMLEKEFWLKEKS